MKKGLKEMKEKFMKKFKKKEEVKMTPQAVLARKREKREETTRIKKEQEERREFWKDFKEDMETAIDELLDPYSPLFKVNSSL